MKVALGIVLAMMLVCPSASRGAEKPGGLSGVLASLKDFDEVSLEQLLRIKVTAAAKHEQSIDEAPSSVTVITQQEIAAHGYETLAEALRGLAGIHVTNDRNYEYIGVRGFAPAGDYNTRILLLVDGHPIDESVWSSVGVGTDGPVDLDIVERIEVVRGPGSALYGTNAIFAVVQIITRPPSTTPGMKVAGALGSFDCRAGRLGWSGPLGKAGALRISGSGMHLDGPDLAFTEFAADRGGVTRGTDSDRYGRLLATFRSGSLRLTGLHTERTKGIPTAPWDGIFNDAGTRTTDTRSFLEGCYEQALRADLGLSARGYLDWSGYKGAWPMNVLADSSSPGEERVVTRESSHGFWFGTEARLAWQPMPQHRFTCGAEARRDRFEMQNVNELPDANVETTLDLHGRSSFYALYGQEEFTPLPHLVITLGLHRDQYASWGGISTPRAALVMEPFVGTRLKVLYGQGFRAPSLGEIEYEDSYTTLANRKLQPERVRTTEVVAERRWSDRFWTRVAGYRNHVTDLIRLCERDDGWLQYQNQGGADVLGAEFEARRSIGAGFEARGSLSYQNARDDLLRNRLTNSPRWLAHVGAVVPLPRRRVTLGLEGRYVGGRDGVHQGSKVQGYFVGDANMTWRTPVPELRIALKVLNVGNTPYSDPAGEEHRMATIRQDGRTWRLKAQYGLPD